MDGLSIWANPATRVAAENALVEAKAAIVQVQEKQALAVNEASIFTQQVEQMASDAIQDAIAIVNTAQTTLDELIESGNSQEIAQAELALNNAQTALVQAQRSHETAIKDVAKVTEVASEIAINDVISASEALENAQNEFDNLGVNPTEDQLAKAQTDIAAAQIALTEAKEVQLNMIAIASDSIQSVSESKK